MANGEKNKGNTHQEQCTALNAPPEGSGNAPIPTPPLEGPGSGSDGVVPLSRLYMTGLNSQLAYNTSRTPSIPGFTDVVVHGDPDYVVVYQVGQYVRVDYKFLANLIKNYSGYNGGNIRLLSCSTGARPDGIAQKLANELGVTVLAPSDTLWTDPSGALTIGPTAISNTGRWIPFFPNIP